VCETQGASQLTDNLLSDNHAEFACRWCGLRHHAIPITVRPVMAWIAIGLTKIALGCGLGNPPLAQVDMAAGMDACVAFAATNSPTCPCRLG